jgi:hypothetical protein
MSKKKLILAGAGCLVLVLGICVSSILVYFLAGNRIRQMLKGGGIAGISTGGDLIGGYEMVSESGGWHPAANARVELNFVAPGTVTLRATKPDEFLTDIGTFTISGQSITLELPEVGRRVSNGHFTFEGDNLVLPFQLFNEAPGTSTWKRIGGSGDALSDAIQGSSEVAQQNGREAALKYVAEALRKNPDVKSAKICGSATVLVTYQDGYQEFYLAPPSSARAKKQDSSLQRENRTGLQHVTHPIARKHRGAMKLLRTQVMLPGLGPGPLMIPGGRGGSAEQQWLANEPEPVSHGDAPPDRTALILAPFHSLPLCIPGTGGAIHPTFENMGEDLEAIKGYLNDAHYDTSSTFVDRQVTVKLIYDKLKEKRWGVFFMATHSGFDEGEGILVTGEQVPIPFSGSRKGRRKFLDDYFQKYLDQNVGGALGQDAYQQLRNSIMVGYVYEDRIPFVAIKSSFFRAVGADFSRSLVVLSACQSAAAGFTDPETDQSFPALSFRETMGARSFAGWSTEVNTELSADIDKEFFHCLSRRTRSDREAMQFAIEDCLGPHDWRHRQAAAADSDKPKMDAHNFMLYRKGKNEPEKYLIDVQLMMSRAARHWTCQFYGGKKLDESVNNLYKYDPDDPKIEPDLYFKEAFNRMKVPKEQIDEVKGELCGYGGDPSRFTLEEQ